MKSTIRFVVLFGVSGSGKTTLAKELSHCNDLYYITKQVTTRPMRKGEHNGVDYYFIDKERYKELDDKGLLVAKTSFNGNEYGTLLPNDELIWKYKPYTNAVSQSIERDDETFIIVVNKEGLENFLKDIKRDIPLFNEYDVQLCILNVTSNKPALRDDRDESVIKKELEEISMLPYDLMVVNDAENGKFVDQKEVWDNIERKFLNRFRAVRVTA